MLSPRKVIYTVVVFVIAVAVVLIIVYPPVKEGAAPDKVEQVPPMPEQALEKFNVTETEQGKPHWVLDASSAQILEKEKKVILQSPNVKFYEKGQYVSTLAASSGTINTENYDIWGNGKCLLTTAKGERLETSNLYYKSDSKKIMTDEKVKLVRQNETIYGRGMEATPDLDVIKIRNQRVEVTLPDKNK